MTGVPTVAAAAQNNAAWCDAMCRAHGGAGVFADDAWSAPTRSPALYPDAVTLRPDTDGDELLARVDAGAGCSVKDSFAMLDLTPAGFRVLFAAEWIARPAADDAPDAAWERVTDPTELHAWEVAWARPGTPTGLFPPALLAAPDVIVVRTHAGGAVLNRAAHCIGVSNLFAEDGDLDGAWRAALAAATASFPNSPIVGYEAGDDLTAAQRNGFAALGPLRVWMKD